MYNYELLFKKFYFDGSFFIIAKKNKKKIEIKKNIQISKFKDGTIIEIQIYIRKIINILIINLKKVLRPIFYLK